MMMRPPKPPKSERRTADTELDAAVDGEARSDLVDHAGVEGSFGRAVDIGAREPEHLDVRIPAIRHRFADGADTMC